jgi:hypothetical protein
MNLLDMYFVVDTVNDKWVVFFCLFSVSLVHQPFGRTELQADLVVQEADSSWTSCQV